MKTKTILELLKIDLKKVPDSKFSEIGKTINIVGEELLNYRALLDYRELDLFTILELKVFPDGNKNVFFKTEDLSEVKPEHLEKVINSVFELYGKDDLNKGKYNSKDFADFNSAEFNTLFGRDWTDSEKFLYPACIMRENNQLVFIIWGVESE